MTQQDIMTILAAAGLLLALLGWAYQLGFLGAKVQRNVIDIEKLNKELDDYKKESSKQDMEWRKEIRESFDKVYRKIDELPCKKPGWKRENC